MPPNLSDDTVKNIFAGVEEDFTAWWVRLKVRLLPVLHGSAPLS